MSVVTDNIDEILFRKKIGKYAFYKAVGISSTAYGKWKAGVYNPKLGNLQRIADFLGVELKDLLDGGGVAEEEESEKTATPEGDGLSDAQIELLTLIPQLDADSARFLAAKARELAEFQRFRDSQ